MAIWQRTIVLIPAQWVEDKNYSVEALYNADGYFDTACVWKHHQPNVQIDKLLDNVLVRTESNISDFKMWGNSSSNEITISVNDESIDEIVIRVDLRKDISNFCFSICQLAKKLQCFLFIPNIKLLIEPDIHLLMQNIQTLTTTNQKRKLK